MVHDMCNTVFDYHYENCMQVLNVDNFALRMVKQEPLVMELYSHVLQLI